MGVAATAHMPKFRNKQRPEVLAVKLNAHVAPIVAGHTRHWAVKDHTLPNVYPALFLDRFAWQALKNPTQDNNNAARALFEQALKIDPNNSEALAGDAATYVWEHLLGWGNPKTDYDAKILDQVDRAIALAPRVRLTHAAVSLSPARVPPQPARGAPSGSRRAAVPPQDARAGPEKAAGSF
jgi:hypothetical protein